MYLVTGGSGFCGVEIVRCLLDAGEKVRVFDLEPFPESQWDVEFVKGDICDPSQVLKACQGIQKIIHAAAKVPISKAGKEFRHVNVDGTKHVLSAALQCGVKKIVYISSSSVQVEEESPVDEMAPYSPVGEYAKSKMESELLCREWVNRGLDVDIVRPRTVVGKGRLGIFDILFDWIADGKKIYVLGKGDNRLQLLHSQDLARLCYLASNHPGSEVFNIGSKNFGTLRHDLTELIAFAGTRSRVVGLPIGLAKWALKILDNLHLSPLSDWHYKTYHHDFFFTNERAHLILNWTPQFGNQEILREAYSAFTQMRSQPRSNAYGNTHRKSLKQGVLGLIKRFS